MENTSKKDNGILIKGGKQPDSTMSAPKPVTQVPNPPSSSGNSQSK